MNQPDEMQNTAAPHPRAAVKKLPNYSAGKPPKKAAPGVSEDAQRTFKLSSNENPFDPHPEVLKAYGAMSELNRYPDAVASTLREELAAYLGVPAEDIVTGAGSLGALAQLLAAFAGDNSADAQHDEVIYAWRSFEAYPILVGVAGAQSVQIPNLPDGRHDLDAMLSAITPNTRVILLCTPNNPTGPVLTRREVQEFLAKVPEDVVVVIDEAYTEFVRDPEAVSGLDVYREHPNVVVLRTFSKAFGLAGLRVGFSVSQPGITEHLRKTAVPFAVSSAAEAAAVASLEHAEAVMANVDKVVAERERVVAALKDQGWNIPTAEGNFVWLELGERTPAFAADALERGISVRPFGTEGVRVSIGEPEGNDIFLELAEAYVV